MKNLVIKELFELQDLKYKDFQSKLIPTVPPDRIIGVRTPLLRKLAKEMTCDGGFTNTLHHFYFEENNLHAFLIEKIRDFDECISQTEKFLPFVDNWATCDSFCPQIFKKNREKLLPYINKWIKSDHTYTVRFAVCMLMRFFLDELFDEKYLKSVADIKSDEYYINMVKAWFFATALAKQYEKTLPYIENNLLDIWLHNKTIQKATESYRISSEQKTYLKALRRVSV